jgi:RNase H-fold protein (predicted Holliday junction resolvase)
MENLEQTIINNENIERENIIATEIRDYNFIEEKNKEEKIIIRKPLDKKEYSKKYRLENKEKIQKQINEWKKKKIITEDKRQKMVDKLNKNFFKRIPIKTLDKMNIKFSEELQKYI